MLRGTYPLRLVTKKLYLSSGVVAAFECKNTLRAGHITKAAKTSALVKSKSYIRRGTLRPELHPPPVYGLLAHSHSWKAESSTPIPNVDGEVAEVLNGIGHPSALIDIICVADLAAWRLAKSVECPWFYSEDFREFRLKMGAPPDGSVSTGFFRFAEAEWEPSIEAPNPIAVLVAELLKWLALEDPDLRPLADYFRIAGIQGSAAMTARLFSLDVLSQEVQERLRHQPPSPSFESFWDPWHGHDD